MRGDLSSMPKPPIHPQPGFYETTVAVVGQGETETLVGPDEVERIITRPRWSYAMASARVDGKAAAKAKARKGR